VLSLYSSHCVLVLLSFEQQNKIDSLMSPDGTQVLFHSQKQKHAKKKKQPTTETDAAALAIHEVQDYWLQFNRVKASVDVNDELSSTPHYLTC
jgi:hypothetical protein